MCIRDRDQEVTLGGETFYHLQQVYDGIPVYGHRVSLLTDANGAVQAAGGDIVPLDGLNTTPTLQGEALEGAAKPSLAQHLSWREEEISIGTPGMLILYLEEDLTPHLAYRVQVLSLIHIYDELENGAHVPVVVQQIESHGLTLPPGIGWNF